MKPLSLPAGFGLYVHWPFCLSKCPYCDFNSRALRTIDQERWQTALVRELGRYGERTQGRTLSSIFFGGGTPSLMAPETVRIVIEEAGRFWRFTDNIEITLEANPGAAEMERFEALRMAGVNRLSLGVQALVDDDLRFLGRRHSVREALNAIERARLIFPRFSFDLIYGRPGQTVMEWSEELSRAVDLSAGHLSLYQLTVEEGTSFASRMERGEFRLPDEDLAHALWEATQAITARAGLPAYEISNHARPGEEARHNLLYWRGGEYVGIGPGAHGRLTLDGRFLATCRPDDPEVWLAEAESAKDVSGSETVLATRERAEEIVLMGLRLREGIDLALFEDITDVDLREVIDEDEAGRLAGDGLIERNGHLRLTPQGVPLLNAITRALLV